MMTNKTKRKIDEWITSPNFNKTLNELIKHIIDVAKNGDYESIRQCLYYLNKWAMPSQLFTAITEIVHKDSVTFRICHKNCSYAADRIIEKYGQEFLYGLCVSELKPYLMEKKIETINNDFK